MGRNINGINDFESWCKQNRKDKLLLEWNYEKNLRSPKSVSYGSHYKASWKCSVCDYEWDAVLKSRTILNAGCPKCSATKNSRARKVPTVKNDVESFCKLNKIEWLLNEWDRNFNEFNPNEICRSSSKQMIIWNCSKCGYQWKCTPNNRIKVSCNNDIHISECPMCVKEKQTSFPEQAIFYYIQKAFPDTMNGNKDNIGMELDIYIPSLNIAIEYDGYAWHKDIKKDLKKNNLCAEKGIKIIRVREKGCPTIEGNDNCIVLNVIPNNQANLTKIIVDICAYFGKSVDVNMERDEPLIMALYQKNKYENSLEYLYPELSKEFHSIRNGELQTKDINKRSARKVWWKCSYCDYEWLATVSSRTAGHNCPACSGRVLVYGKNDFETYCKDTKKEILLNEWDYKKNSVKPCEITKKNAYKAYWICSVCGASYKASIYNRANGGNCPVCSGKQVLRGFNDFQTWCINNKKENILKEWATDNELLPNEVSHGSGKRIAWICSNCGHHWSATLDNRKKGKGCPVCGESQRRKSIAKTLNKE